MKLIRLFIFMSVVILSASSVWALKGVLSTDEDIMSLKKDVLAGKIRVGETRLEQIRERYGEAASIKIGARKITYDYGDLKIDFNKDRFWKEWSTDSFKSAVYTSEIDDLRYDLGRQQIVGDNITLAFITKKYGEPTESNINEEDGGTSHFYWGNIKLTFENKFYVDSWRGDALNAISDAQLISGTSGALTSAPAVPVAPAGKK